MIITNELASIAAKLEGNKSKLEFRIDIATALATLDRISQEQISDVALHTEFTQLRQRVEDTAKELGGITASKASPKSSLSGTSYASFFGKKSDVPSVSSSTVAQKSLESLTQLQQKLADVPTAGNNNN